MSMLYNILAIFIGSGLGGVCRYVLSTAIQEHTPGTLFPWGTFAVNVLGCMLIGLLYGLGERCGMANTHLRLMATVGFCGGFTTFSTFINENVLLFGRGDSSLVGLSVAVVYMCASIILGFAALYGGHALAKAV